jgi:Family of unknown function (DUF6416)
MATVTIEVPDELLGDIYIAAGRVLRDAQEAPDDLSQGAPDEPRQLATAAPRAGTRPDRVQVTFDIPDKLLGEFYLHVGATLNMAREQDEPAEDTLAMDWATDNYGDDLTARGIWRQFSPKAQAVFSLLIENSGVTMTGDEISQKLDIPNGNRGVAGIVAWPARRCAEAGRPSLFRFSEADGGYWMDPDAAELFAEVRDAARPRPRPASN